MHLPAAQTFPVPTQNLSQLSHGMIGHGANGTLPVFSLLIALLARVSKTSTKTEPEFPTTHDYLATRLLNGSVSSKGLNVRVKRSSLKSEVLCDYDRPLSRSIRIKNQSHYLQFLAGSARLTPTQSRETVCLKLHRFRVVDPELGCQVLVIESPSGGAFINGNPSSGITVQSGDGSNIRNQTHTDSRFFCIGYEGNSFFIQHYESGLFMSSVSGNSSISLVQQKGPSTEVEINPC
ncbi:hypothetical protein SK128_013073 [Halocaridina rubra]|uniref:Uncharacterized protein n=1 Tax=Halocaridina rubra TaxID=373956 RepID=A0AAN8WPG2_HALRR